MNPKRVATVYATAGLCFGALLVPAIVLLSTPVDAMPPASSAPLQVDERIVQTSKASLGKPMWHGYGLPSGKLGCAAAVSNVLKASGVKGVSSAAVYIVRRQLLKHPDYVATEVCVQKGRTSGVDTKTFMSVSKPGDVLLAFSDPPDRPNLGPNAHCGFVGTDGKVYTNDWNDGIWKYAPVEQYFSFYPYLYVVRLTAKAQNKG